MAVDSVAVTIIFVPWRTSRDRERIWRHTLPILESVGWPVVTLDDGTEPFSTARSLNLAKGYEWEVAMFIEADITPPVDRLTGAATLALTAGYVYPYTRLHQYQMLTDRKIRTRTPYAKPDQLGRRCCPPAGPRLVARWLFDAIDGYDPEFRGWGNEDEDFNIRAAIHLTSLGLPAYREIDGDAVEHRHRPRTGAYGAYRARNAEHFAAKLQAWHEAGVFDQ